MSTALDSNAGNLVSTVFVSFLACIFSLGAAYGKDISKVLKVTDPSLMIPERFDDSSAPRLAKIGQDGVSFSRLVEVKKPKERISPDQHAEIAFLRSINIPARVLRLIESK